MALRLAFAVAAHLEPEVLLVDEVLAVGDAAFQKKCLGKMGDVARAGPHGHLCQPRPHGRAGAVPARDSPGTRPHPGERAGSRRDRGVPGRDQNVAQRYSITQLHSVTAPSSEPVRFRAKPGGERSTGHRFTSSSRRRDRMRIEELAVLVHDTSTGASGCSIFGRPTDPTRRTATGPFKVAAHLSSLPLVEGEYRIGLSLRTGDAHDILYDLVTLDVVARRQSGFRPLSGRQCAASSRSTTSCASSRRWRNRSTSVLSASGFVDSRRRRGRLRVLSPGIRAAGLVASRSGWRTRRPTCARGFDSSFPEVDVASCDFREALRHGRAQDHAAIVALPNSLHEAAVNDALDLGMDVLCEKPLALTAAACSRLADQADQVNRLLAVGMTRRFLPSVQAARRVIDKGWLGDLRSVHVADGHAFAWSSESGGYFRRENGGVLANIGVHALDLVAYLCGPLVPVAYEDDWRGGAEANAQYQLRTNFGARVSIRLSYTHALDNGVRLIGSAGEIRFDHVNPEVRYRSLTDGLAADVSIERPYRFGRWPTDLVSTFAEQLCDFHDASRRRAAPRATAREAVDTARLIDWAYDQHASHQASGRIQVAVSAPRLEPGRIVVTGGTGFVGGHVIDALSSIGHHDIVVPVRSYRSGANAGRFPVRFERVDLLDTVGVGALCAGARFVIHLAFGRDGEHASRVTVEGTKNVVEAAIAAGVEAVAVISTAAVFGDAGPREIDETYTARLDGNEYEQTKAQAEQWALARAVGDLKTRIVVVNPACVYGRGGKTFTELPARLLHENSFCWIEDGRGTINYVHASNLADAILLALGHPGTHGERFIVSDGATTWREFFTELFGDRVSALPSYTRDELSSLARSSEPTLRDLGRAVVADPEVRRILRQNARLGRLKTGVARLFPDSYRRLQSGGKKAPRSAARSAAPAVTPPLYLADLFGPSATRLSSAKAHRVLGWSSAKDLAMGQADARAWLTELGLIVQATTR